MALEASLFFQLGNRIIINCQKKGSSAVSSIKDKVEKEINTWVKTTHNTLKNSQKFQVKSGIMLISSQPRHDLENE